MEYWKHYVTNLDWPHLGRHFLSWGIIACSFIALDVLWNLVTSRFGRRSHE
ncbi:MAG: hypothetical protein R3E01_04225 [Pirellulaceae bacterium]